MHSVARMMFHLRTQLLLQLVNFVGKVFDNLLLLLQLLPQLSQLLSLVFLDVHVFVCSLSILEGVGLRGIFEQNTCSRRQVSDGGAGSGGELFQHLEWFWWWVELKSAEQLTVLGPYLQATG